MTQRMRRVNESVKEVLAELLPELKDPRIGFVTITEVRTSADLRHAEVFYTVLSDDPVVQRRTEEGLSSAAPLMRRELGARLRMKHVPGLEFVHDPLPGQARRIERLLEGEPEDDHR